jgi:RNA polymerase sigma-70 factor (ECF subfamily)
MHALAPPFEGLLTAETDLAAEFEGRLPELGPTAVRVAFSVLRQRADAEDVAQEALVKAYRSLHSLRDPRALRAWVVRMTFRLAIDARRAQQRRLVRDGADAASRPAESLENPAGALERERLLSALDGLPEKLRLTLTLSAVEGYGVGEIAALLGVPEGTVKSRLFLARRRMAEALS